MRFRSLLVITAIVSSVLGAAVVWLVLTVPNDIAAESLLKDARKSIEAHDNAKARVSLTKIMQQYPRTDAAAAATVALVALGDQERQKLAADIDGLRTQTQSTQTQLAAMQQKLEEAKKAAAAPPPAPPTVAAAPAPAKAPAKKAPAKHKRSRKRKRH